MLRDEFRDWRGQSLKNRSAKSPEHILITMGGVDLNNYSLRILKELVASKHSKGCNFKIVIGQSYPHKTKLRQFVEFSEKKISILVNVTNMAEIMSKADLCIGAAGSTSWERCCLGLPALIIPIAHNQKEIAKSLHNERLAIYSSLTKLKTALIVFLTFQGDYALIIQNANGLRCLAG